MMCPKFSPFTGREVVLAAQRAGFEIVRQRGSHIRMTRGNQQITVTQVRVSENTLHTIAKSMGLSRAQIMELLKQ